MSAADTLPRLLARNAEQWPGDVALREKARGIWHETTWAALHEEVGILALGLRALGFQRGDSLAVLAGNRPEWLAVALAAQAAGGVVIALDPEAERAEIAAALAACGAAFVFAEDQRQVDHVLDSLAPVTTPPKSPVTSDAMPVSSLRRLIHLRSRGLRKYRHPALLALQAVRDAGADAARGQKATAAALVAQGVATDPALVPCDPGCKPGAPLSAAQLISAAEALQRELPRRRGDELVSFLPLWRESEQVATVAAFLAQGFTLNFPESPETVRDDLREIGPHSVLAPPRFWDELHAWVLGRAAAATPLKRRLFALLFPRKDLLAERLLYRSLRDKLGLSRARACSSLGGAPSAETARFFAALQLPLATVALPHATHSPEGSR